MTNGQLIFPGLSISKHSLRGPKSKDNNLFDLLYFLAALSAAQNLYQADADQIFSPICCIQQIFYAHKKMVSIGNQMTIKIEHR